MRRKCLRALVYLILFAVLLKLALVSLFVGKSSTTQCHDEAKAAYRVFVQHSQLTGECLHFSFYLTKFKASVSRVMLPSF